MRGLSLLLAGGFLLALTAGCGGGGGPSESVPPVIDNLQVTRDGSGAPLVSARVTDDLSGVSSVTAVVVEGAANGPVTRRYRMPLSTGITYALTLSRSSIRCMVEARDNAGNVATTAEQAVPPPSPTF